MAEVGTEPSCLAHGSQEECGEKCARVPKIMLPWPSHTHPTVKKSALLISKVALNPREFTVQFNTHEALSSNRSPHMKWVSSGLIGLCPWRNVSRKSVSGKRLNSRDMAIVSDYIYVRILTL